MTLLSEALPYRSFWMGGFEGADHLNGEGLPLDMAAANGHHLHFESDYADAARLGLRSVRESIGWRLGEAGAGRYRLARAVAMAQAARRQGVQLLWTLMHYGTPADVSVLDDAMIARFAAFAAEVARVLAPHSDAPTVYTPINEIGFLAWAVTATGMMAPYVPPSPAEAPLLEGHDDGARPEPPDLGYEVKVRLVKAALAAMRAMRQVDPHARFLHVEPVVHIVAPREQPALAPLARQAAAYQWQAWDMLAGRERPELGGSPDWLDLVGVNHYHSGQWELGTGRRLSWAGGDPRRRAFAHQLAEVWQRYRRPVLLSETSHVGEGRAAWLMHIADELARAQAEGVPIAGCCLYPLVDRPDWGDLGRWHRSGVFDVMPPSPNGLPAPGRPPPWQRLAQPAYLAALRRCQVRLPSRPLANRPPLHQADQAAAEHAGPLPRSAAHVHPLLHPPLSVSFHPSSLSPIAMHTPTSTTAATLPTLLVFCHLRWGFVYQRPQQLMSRLAQHYRVLFVEEPAPPASGEAAGDTPRLEIARPAPGVEVLTPHTGIDAPGFHDDHLPLLSPLLAEHLRSEGVTETLVWFYTPMALPLLSVVRATAVVYDCMDELSAFHGAPLQLRQREAALMQRADLVLTGGPSLYEARRTLHANVHCLPSAVDAAHFSPERLLPGSREARACDALHAGIDGPRLGFYGVIDERFDVALLAALVDARPDWQWLMAGPVVKIDPASLPRRANLHWLGMQAYAVLPYLLAAWDVSLLPFALNDSTRFISPTKTLEYMAARKPIVSTAVRDVELLYGEVVRIAQDAGSFVAQCEAALNESPAERATQQAAMASIVWRMSWDQTSAQIAELLARAAQAGQATSIGKTATAAAQPRRSPSPFTAPVGVAFGR